MQKPNELAEVQTRGNQVVIIDGQSCDPGSAAVSVFDHGFLYGDGVFEGLRFYNRRVLKLGAHMNRLKASATALCLELPQTIDQIRVSILEAVKLSPVNDGYLRVVITRGRGPLGIDPSHCETGRVIIMADELNMIDAASRDQGAKLIIASTRRLAGDQLDARIKSLNYLNQILGRIEANAAGADEAIVLNQQGFVAEGTADNVFIVRDRCLLTPPVTDGALDGITRGLVMEVSKDIGLEVREHSLTPYDLYNADECFLTGTGAELIPVREIAGRHIKRGEVFNEISRAFRDALAGDRWFDE